MHNNGRALLYTLILILTMIGIVISAYVLYLAIIAAAVICVFLLIRLILKGAQ